MEGIIDLGGVFLLIVTGVVIGMIIEHYKTPINIINGLFDTDFESEQKKTQTAATD